ncbi:hypothetical protein ACFYPB_37970 [Streptomyces olivaceoviridis]|uniref:hypothetical protein n=1 Tax=Streptomyces olivaceoviridis TaxID=1921 RepID=UPI00368A87EE
MTSYDRDTRPGSTPAAQAPSPRLPGPRAVRERADRQQERSRGTGADTWERAV